MPFIQTVVAASATPGNAVQTAIEAALATHASWSFVEQYTETDTYRIWKNDGTQNAAGQDFYLAIGRTATANQIGFKVYESWNSTTHRGTAPVPHNSSGSNTPSAVDLTTGAANVTITDTSTAGRAYFPSYTGLSTTADIALSIFLTKSRLVVASPGMDTLVVGAFPKPAMYIDARVKNIYLSFGQNIGTSWTAGSSAFASFTRSWGSSSIYSGLAAPSTLKRVGRLTSTLAVSDSLLARIEGSEVVLCGSNGTSPSPGYRADWPDAVTFISASSPTRGDVLVTSSAEYVFVSNMNSNTAECVFLPKNLADS